MGKSSAFFELGSFIKFLRVHEILEVKFVR